MAGTNAPILELDALTNREHVLIRSELHPDGRLYEMLNVDELGVLAHQRIGQSYQTVLTLQEKSPDTLSPNEAKQLKKALDDAVTIILPDLEKEVLQALSDHKLAAIVTCFYEQIRQEDEAGPPPTGAA